MSDMTSSATYLYRQPGLTEILIISSYLFFLNVAGDYALRLIHAELVGYIAIGMIWGPPISNILETAWLETFTAFGYIGLILLVLQGAQWPLQCLYLKEHNADIF
jgi:hypothetical protein